MEPRDPRAPLPDEGQDDEDLDGERLEDAPAIGVLDPEHPDPPEPGEPG
jgi:hypothetical protein